MGHGWEIVEAKLPLLMTVIETANEPRPPAAKRVLRYKRAQVLAEWPREVKAAMPEAADARAGRRGRRAGRPLSGRGLLVEQWDLDRISADLQRCGLAGSPTKVHRVQCDRADQGRLHRDAGHRGRRAAVDSRIGRGSHAGLDAQIDHESLAGLPARLFPRLHMIEVNRQGEVWVFAEQEDGSLHDVVLELCGKARELADQSGRAGGGGAAGHGRARRWRSG